MNGEENKVDGGRGKAFRDRPDGERDEVSKDFYSIIWNYGTERSGKQKGRGVIFNQVQ